MVATLALDLGTHCGWALHKTPVVLDGQKSPLLGESHIQSGTWDLTIPTKTKKSLVPNWDRRFDLRFMWLAEEIKRVVKAYEIKKVVFEDVQFSTYTLQTQLWSTFRAAVWSLRLDEDSRFVDIDCLNTASLKKFATGHGGATKAMMAAWLVKKHPDRYNKLSRPDPKKDLYIQHANGVIMDDNEVDALHLLDYFYQT